ncbi:MAG: F0F1 ATP synthase subunit A [Candidatus Onthovivens sp.]|nr:F0F1 ATP synthase subunit A [Candidatus Onthovivens sp.]
MGEQLDRMLSFKAGDILNGTFLSTCILISLICLLCVWIKISSKKSLNNPLEAPKGIFGIFVYFVEFMEGVVVGTMGEKNRAFAKIIIPLSMYLFFGFIFGLTGLPSPAGNLAFPLILALFSFCLIHGTAIKHNKIHYFHRFIEPLPFFLPINLITMWAPLLSLTLRLFGNATAGYCLMTVVYYGFAQIGSMLFGTSYIGVEGLSTPWGPATFYLGSPIAAILHAYFDLFSGFIQTTVFIMLTMIYVYQEQPEDADQVIEEVQFN